MSRFVEIASELRNDFTFARFRNLPDEVCERLDSDSCRVEVLFTHFRNKVAPVSGVESWLDSDALFVAGKDPSGTRAVAGVSVPVNALCPCSKAISKYGAHNQRSDVSLSVELADGCDVSLDELAAIVESGCSTELYGALKRPDEKFVTERAYDNPKFVEDIVRDIAAKAANDSRFAGWRVKVENFESIHNHSAYACIRSPGFEMP